MGSVFDKSIPELRRWSPRRPISARHLNEPVDAINRMTRGIAPPRMVSEIDRAGKGGPDGVGGIQIQRFILVQDADAFPDHLVCRAFGSDPLDFDSVNIAKPLHLQRIHLDGVTLHGLRYEYSSNIDRTVFDEVDETLFRNERVLPRYHINDNIYAIPFAEIGSFADEPFVLLDDNWRLRDWAVVYDLLT